MHGIERFEDVEFFRNGSVHKFYCLKALIITLKQVITPVVEKNTNKQTILMSKTSMVRLTGRVL